MKSADFSYIFDKPIKSADAAYTILARAGQTSNPRLGVIISKKNISSAARRNRVKRIVRESFRQHKHIINTLDIVVICKKHCEQMINEKLFERLRKHWKFLNEHSQ
jgi:ribonuclease P protein component